MNEEIIMDDEIPIKEIVKSNRGGKRKGAGRKVGRPLGSPDAQTLKKKIREYTTPREALSLIRRIKIAAKSDKKVALWYAEMLFGKPRQNQGFDGGEDNKPITIAKILDELEN